MSKSERMRTRALLFLLATVLAVPSASRASSAVDCGNDQGLEHLTLGSQTLEFEAPAIAAPELVATAAETGTLVTHHRSADFRFLLDLAPYQSGSLKARVDWENLSDYDLTLRGGDGQTRASSAASNIDEGQTTFEELEGVVYHCERVSILVRNWAGMPNQPLTLTIEVTGSGDLLACGADDPAPGCAGKEEGEAPVAAEDDRSRLYLGGDPGQLVMPYDYAYTFTQEPIPFDSSLVAERPTSGTPNQHTRPLVGHRSPEQPSALRNPFIAHYDVVLDVPMEIKGSPSAMLWVSSASADTTSTIFADLYADDFLIATASITGNQLANLRDPTALFFDFSEADHTAYSSLTLQVGMDPVATTTPSVGNPADAHFTLWYGSVQFQSRLTIPS